MVELVFALLLIQDHKIIEHRYHESLSQCMKAKRYAMKDKSSQDRVVYKCIKSKANIEIYMGEKKITSLILDWWRKPIKKETRLQSSLDISNKKW